MNYYELLEISSSASIEVIRNAYKTLAKKYHPDTYKGDISFAEEKMKLLNEAVSVLENEDKRKEYNRLNGINPFSPSGRSDYGKNNMVNMDENGEPIFFSYDVFDTDEQNDSDDAESFGRSYMDIIDDFIKNSKLERKSKRRAAKNKEKEKEKEKEPVIVDIDDISEINIEKPVQENIEFQYDNPAAYSQSRFDGEIMDEIDEMDEMGEIDEESFRTINLRGRSKQRPKNKNLSRNTRLYYMLVAFLITLIVVFFILIMQSLNLNNIKELMKGLSGGPDSNDAYVFDDSETSREEPEDIDLFIPDPVNIVDVGDDIPEPIQNTADENDRIENPGEIAQETTKSQAGGNPVIKPPVSLPTAAPETKKPAATQPISQPPPLFATTTEPVTEPFIEPTTVIDIDTIEELTEPGTDMDDTTEEPAVITDGPADNNNTEPASEIEIKIETQEPVSEPEETAAPADPDENIPDEER